MLKNTLINRQATIQIAKALQDFSLSFVFVGGAIVSLYIDDLGANDIRPTKDIDVVFKISSLTNLEQLRQELIQAGFFQTAEDDVICRFRYGEIKVDVMSTNNVGWAPANDWFKPGFKEAIELQLDNVKITVLPLPYFFSNKICSIF